MLLKQLENHRYIYIYLGFKTACFKNILNIKVHLCDVCKI